MNRLLRHLLALRAEPRTRQIRANLKLKGLEPRFAPATLTVTSDTDTGSGAGASGDLRYCLTQANANSDLDTIQFDPTFFNSITPRTIKLTAGPLNITNPLNLVGPGESICTISGENSTNILVVSTAGVLDPVSISDLTVSNGRRTVIGIQGAGISIAKSDLTLTKVTISNCFNRDSGGGLAIQAGKLTGSFVTVTNNTVNSLVYGRGVGIYVSGTAAAQLTNCTISNNLASSSGGSKFCFGAGIGDTTSGDVVLQNCTISGNTNDQFGGGVYVSNNPTGGNTTLIGCTLSGNFAGFAGAGLATSSFDAKITIQDCTFDGNTGVTSGGVLSIVTGNPTITITNSEFSNNDAVAGPGGVFAIFNIASPTITIAQSSFVGNSALASFGGVFYSQSAATISLQIDDSTFANNTALSGGAIVVSPLAAAGGSVTMRNSTLVGNKTLATGNGGAIVLGSFFAGTAQINNCTLSGNSAGTGGGGGLSVSSTQTSCQVIIVNSIIAGNSAGGLTDGPKSDIGRENAGPTITVDFSLIGVVPATPPFTEPTPGSNKTGTIASPLDPMLRPLGNYGGATWTRPPMPLSSAINSGTAVLIPNDQRGPGFDRAFGGAVDMGAVEDNVALPWVSAVSVTNITANTTAQYEFSITFADTNAVDNATLDFPGAIQVRGPGFATPATATLKNPVPGPGTPLTATYVLTPAGGEWDPSDNGVYKISVVGGTIFDTDAIKHSVVGDDYGTFSVAIPISLVVNANNDEFTDTDGRLSLREAVHKANLSLGNDTIDFSPVVFSVDQLTVLTQSAITITDSVTIRGPAITYTLDANFVGHHFSIGGSGQFDVSISKLTMVNGMRVGSAAGLNGGSIVIGNENLSLTDCNFKGNSAQAGGGAIAVNASGNLTITNCRFDTNTVLNGSNRTGGAIFFNGSSNLAITGSTFVKNHAEGAGGALSLSAASIVTIDKSTFDQNSTTKGNGGAIRSIAVAPGSLTLSNSTLSNNLAGGTANGNGGAIALDGVATPMTITNTTISGNSAIVAGGGLWLNNLAAAVKIQNSTMTLNSAQNTTLGGGGVAVTQLQTGGTLTISSTIIAQNTAMPGLPRDIAADVLVSIAGNNDLIGVADIGNFMLSGSGHQSGSDSMPLNAKLSALANNGGPTFTHALQFGSPGVDNGNNDAGLTTDQRGLGRSNATKTDIGAYESHPPQVVSISVNGGASQRSLVTSVKVTFSEPVVFPNGIDMAFVVSRYDKGTPGSVALNFVQSGSDITINFKAGGSIGIDPGASLEDGKYELKIFGDHVQGAGGFLDGNKNGVHNPGADNVTSNFHRLFGDANGNGAVTSDDFAVFRTFFGLGASIFDFNNDGSTNSDDFAAFRGRFGLSGY